jgi:hypothetical protein
MDFFLNYTSEKKNANDAALSLARSLCGRCTFDGVSPSHQKVVLFQFFFEKLLYFGFFLSGVVF